MFNTKITRLIITSVILGSLIIAAMPVSAQDGLTDEEMALLSDLATIRDTVRSYDSYVETAIQTQSTIATIRQEDTVVQEQNSTETIESEGTFIRGENPNGHYVATITVENGTDISIIDGELIYADGTLYGAAEVVEGAAENPLPEGFVEIPDPTNDFTFERLQPDDFVKSVLGEANEDNPLYNVELLADVVGSITLEEGEYDGIPGTLLTMVIPGENLYTFMISSGSESFENPTTQALLSYITPESYAILQVYRDADGNPLAYQGEFVIVITDVLMNAIDPTMPEGISVDMTVTLTEISELSAVNEPLEPTAAPEM